MHNTLFIDIDGTITRFRDEKAEHAGLELLNHRLLALMRDEAARQNEMTPGQAEAIIHDLFHRKTWWDWCDFLNALKLDVEAFWRIADISEKRYIQPREANLHQMLAQLNEAGYELIITSNNPASGIQHKMRLAGLNDRWQREYISRLLSTDRVEAMKWHAEYWHRALKLADKKPDRVVVIGDTWHDDVLMPREAGIMHQVLFEQNVLKGADDLTDVVRVKSWSQVVAHLLERSFVTRRVLN